MRRTATLTLLFALIPVHGAVAGPPGLEVAPEPEDHHWRPAAVEWWSDAPTPPSEAASEYPLAAAFDPACSCNFTANGLVSYDHVVVHTMQGSYAGTKSWFKNPAAQVSAHYIMRSVDGEVTQMVLDKDKAWHVGSSNSTSLGIEHEGYVDDPAKWYTWETYVSSARLARWLTIRHDIPVDRTHILGHVELPNQSHTDPGPGWNWDMYMGLVRDVVPPGEIHVVVVDRSKACTLTANKDTYLRRTAEPLELLGVDELCPISAGDTVTYLHASADIGGRRRLLMEAGPCGGQGLDTEAFVDPADFSPLCDMTAMAAVGASVSLDGGAAKPVGPDGVLLLPPVNAGAHTLDVSAPGVFEPGSENVDLKVYPGVRVAIGVDPVVMEPPPPPPPPDTTGGEETSGGGETGVDATGDASGAPTSSGGGSSASDSGGGSSASGSGGGSSASGGSGDATGAVSGEPGDPPGPGGPVLPPGYGQDEELGCGCATGAPAGGWALAGLLLLVRRRRRAR